MAFLAKLYVLIKKLVGSPVAKYFASNRDVIFLEQFLTCLYKQCTSFKNLFYRTMKMTVLFTESYSFKNLIFSYP